MKTLSIDIETFSTVNLKEAGLYTYVQSPSFEILLFAYSIDHGPEQCVELMSDTYLSVDETIPAEVISALFNPAVIKTAYNAAFEWYCLSKFFKPIMNPAELTPEAWLPQWHDTMLQALYCGLPAGLDATSKALGFAQDKQKMAAGKALIRYFCVPCTPTNANGHRQRNYPEHDEAKWNLFKTYNKQDVTVEMAIDDALAQWPVPDFVQKQWVQDLIINSRGVALDTQMCSSAINIGNQLSDRLTAEAIKLTGLNNPNSLKQLKKWLSEETEEDIDTLRKNDVSDLLGKDIGSDTARRVLEIRQELGKTSVTKYAAAEKCVGADGRARGVLQFYGAGRTGRWAGRLIQVQNLPRTYINLSQQNLARNTVKSNNADLLKFTFGSVSDTLSQLIRTLFVPAKGCCFIDADFSAIEARVISWLAGEQWRLDVFKTHGKIYEASAAQMFGVPIEKIKKGNPEYALRAKGKVAELALGYQGSSGALIQMGALKMGLSEEELPDIVSRWRSTNKRIQDLWYQTENAAIEVINNCQQIGVSKFTLRKEFNPVNGLNYLTVFLPSGRKLFYYKPILTVNSFGKKSIGYFGTTSQKKTFSLLDTYGGKLIENITQAIARDCLAEAIDKLEAAGYRVVFHIHDEVVIEYPNPENAENALKDVIRIMSQPPVWAPDLPLNADGWVGEFFTKD